MAPPQPPVSPASHGKSSQAKRSDAAKVSKVALQVPKQIKPTCSYFATVAQRANFQLLMLMGEGQFSIIQAMLQQTHS